MSVVANGGAEQVEAPEKGRKIIGGHYGIRISNKSGRWAMNWDGRLTRFMLNYSSYLDLVDGIAQLTF